MYKAIGNCWQKFDSQKKEYSLNIKHTWQMLTYNLCKISFYSITFFKKHTYVHIWYKVKLEQCKTCQEQLS